MNTKHTPGPWVVDENFIVRGAELSGPGGAYRNPIPIASAWVEDAFVGPDSTEQSRANARLIAAAPDLLKALGRVLPQFEALLADCKLSSKDTVNEARAAIAKATGEA